jgi:MFS family permease
MIDLRLFGHRLFAIGVAVSFISFIGMSSMRFLMPFYLQVVQGYSPQQMGLIMVPAAVTLIVLGPVGGRLSDRYGWRIFNVAGLILSAIGLFLLARANEDSPLALIVTAMVFQSGVGIFNAPNNSSILSTVDPRRYGVVSVLLNLVRNSGNVTGIAIVTAIVTAVMASNGLPPALVAISDGPDSLLASGFTSGIRTAYFVTGSLVLVGIALSFIKGDRAASTDGV